MKKILKGVGDKNGELGQLEFPVFENVDEVVENYGDRQTMVLLQRAINIDVERIGRDLLKKDAAEEGVLVAQAAVDNYKPGVRGSGKPTLKTLMSLITIFGEAGQGGHPEAIGWMLEGQRINQAEGVEAACSYLRSKEAEL